MWIVPEDRMNDAAATSSIRTSAVSWTGLLARSVRPSWFEALLGRHPLIAWLALNAATTALYFVLGIAVSRFFSAFGFFPAPIWLPASVALAAAMIGGARVAPGLFLGSCLTNAVLFDAPAHVVAMISFTNALGPILGAAIIARVSPDGEPFRRLSGMFGFLAGGVVVHGIVVATGGALAIWSSVPGMPAAEAWSIWQRWWISDAGGALYAAPAILLWLIDRPAAPESAPETREHALAVSIATLAATTFLFASGGIGPALNTFAPYLLVLPLAWLTLRVSLRTAYSLFTLVLVIATAATISGGGPFAAAGLARPLTALGGMLVLFSANLLLVAALVNEHRGASAESRAKSAFLAAISHELRTPLPGMLGMAEIVRDEAAAGSQTRRNAALILDSGSIRAGIFWGSSTIFSTWPGRRPDSTA
jgi:integral membrane sensor domain MASE1